MRIFDLMTPCPYTISAATSIEECIEKMELQQVRHMPVVDDDGLVGVVAEKDLRLIKFCCSAEVDVPNVGDIAGREPTIVSQETSLFDVAHTMAEKKLDYVLVSDEGDDRIVGIFTTVDACRVIRLLQDKVES